jgi:hypothetical protein
MVPTTEHSCGRALRLQVHWLLALSCLSSHALALSDEELANTPETTRPMIKPNRWQEDWSPLADQQSPQQPLDELKYIPLGHAGAGIYASLGLNLRQRFESVDAPAFGTGNRSGDSYLLDRLQVHADVRLYRNWQIFTQLEDVRTLDKATITPVDRNPLDLRQAFLAYTGPVAAGLFKFKFGRQEIGFDLQRFVSTRDGPNVRQAFDAIWLDYEQAPWRVISFWSRPVQYRNRQVFDDFSNSHFQYGGFRIERQHVGPGDLAIYYSRWELDNASYLDASGDERRNILDIRYFGSQRGNDWDIEAMGQQGNVGANSALAWAIGARAGHTFSAIGWEPRIGLQVDAASGDRHPGDGKLGTFNPLFPNGYYFTLAGFTTYSNLLNLKPSITVTPLDSLILTGALGFQWRQTTGDAVYVQPNISIANTAGKGNHWTGAYMQLRADWSITHQLSGAIEAVHYVVGGTLRSASGHDSNYLGVELKFGW